MGTVGTDLCLPGYVDVLEVRQARGVWGKGDDGKVLAGSKGLVESPPETGNSPWPFRQLDLFDYRGPRSTCCQSKGIPPSSTGPPPPHLSPFITTIRPHIAFWIRVGANPSETSAPVAGQER